MLGTSSLWILMNFMILSPVLWDVLGTAGMLFIGSSCWWNCLPRHALQLGCNALILVGIWIGQRSRFTNQLAAIKIAVWLDTGIHQWPMAVYFFQFPALARPNYTWPAGEQCRLEKNYGLQPRSPDKSSAALLLVPCHSAPFLSVTRSMWWRYVPCISFEMWRPSHRT